MKRSLFIAVLLTATYVLVRLYLEPEEEPQGPASAWASFDPEMTPEALVASAEAAMAVAPEALKLPPGLEDLEPQPEPSPPAPAPESAEAGAAELSPAELDQLRAEALARSLDEVLLPSPDEGTESPVQEAPAVAVRQRRHIGASQEPLPTPVEQASLAEAEKVPPAVAEKVPPAVTAKPPPRSVEKPAPLAVENATPAVEQPRASRIDRTPPVPEPLPVQPPAAAAIQAAAAPETPPAPPIAAPADAASLARFTTPPAAPAAPVSAAAVAPPAPAPDRAEGGRDEPSPRAPAGVSAALLGARQVEVTWAAGEGGSHAAQYEVYRDGKVVERTTGTQLLDTSVVSSRKHCYRVRALGWTGRASPDSVPACVTMPDTAPPSAPGRPAATPVSTTEIHLAWDASIDDVGVVGYEIRREDASVATVTKPWARDFGLASDREHCYQVRAFDAAKNYSQPSPPFCAKPGAVTALQVPKDVRAVRLAPQRVLVHWVPTSDPNALYRVYGDSKFIGLTRWNSFTTAGSLGSAYQCFTVSALDGKGQESARSEQSCAPTTEIAAGQ